MKLAFLGDSITLGCGLSDRSARFSTLVSRALTSDGCHPNEDGHRWLAEKVEDALREKKKK